MTDPLERGPVDGRPAAATPGPALRRAPLLAGMRIRKKLIVLHTVFSIGLAVILLLALRPAIREVVRKAELTEAVVAMELFDSGSLEHRDVSIEGLSVRIGAQAAVGLSDAEARRARAASGGSVVVGEAEGGSPRLVRWDEPAGEFIVVEARLPSARKAVVKLYLLLTAALLGVYFLIALLLEVFVLPRQVYEPIARLLRADLAVQAGDIEREIIPERAIPADELGEIMRSRNESVLKLRRQEKALARALDQLEIVAMELKRKNHLLETARQNLADQDRLASLGMMSAGIAHELNTPLAVLKGQVERLADAPRDGVSSEQAALMLRVVRRLERLSESLLDFARVRPPAQERVEVRPLIEDAWTLVRLDRDAAAVTFINDVDQAREVIGDPDRLGQVFVNLLRNAVDAGAAAGRRDGTIRVSTDESVRDGAAWMSITVADDGPGIDPAVLPRLFEPFTTTRLDSRGTGLGLAVAEGIIREHGGVILARNAAPAGSRASEERAGAVFEVMLPVEGAPSVGDDAPAAAGHVPGGPPVQT